MKTQFDHEKLKVYQDSIVFNAWVGKLLGGITAKAAVKDQLDRAATSIPLNIAEGNGKFSGKDRARFFEIARGSAVECSACLDVLVAREMAVASEMEPAKMQLVEIVNMLMGLLRRFSEREDRVREDSLEFCLQREQEQEQEQD